jgi:hypothetical protein
MELFLGSEIGMEGKKHREMVIGGEIGGFITWILNLPMRSSPDIEIPRL